MKRTWLAAIVAEVKARSDAANTYKASRSASAWTVMVLSGVALVLILVAR